MQTPVKRNAISHTANKLRTIENKEKNEKIGRKREREKGETFIGGIMFFFP